jgi:cephalosporin-C deacetylase
MPVFEMSMVELQEYQGTNPRPDDFAAYWDKALSELGGVDAQVSLTDRSTPATFAELFDLTFTGVRGARIHAQYLRPARTSTPHPAVLMFHGYSGDSGDWTDKLGLVAQGYSVAALDCRGQGGSSEDVGGVKGYTFQGHIVRGLDGDPEDLLFRQIYLDCVQLAQIVMAFSEVDPDRVGVLGVSQGGGLALACASLEPRIRRVASVFPFLCDFQRVWEMDLAEKAYEELRGYFRRFDPMHQREEAIFTRLGYIDVKNLTDRISGDVLMTTGLMDTVCPPSTQFAAYNRITAPKRMRIYPDYEHELPLPGANDANFEFLCGL